MNQTKTYSVFVWLIAVFLIAGTVLFLSNTSDSSYANESKSVTALDKKEIIDKVISYVDKLHPGDTLIEIESDIQVKKSNVHGIEIDGKRYYYNLNPHMSYDPVARGVLHSSAVDIIHYEESEEMPLVIYTIQ